MVIPSLTSVNSAVNAKKASMDPFSIAALLSGVGGSILDAFGAGKQRELEQKLTREQMAAQKQQFGVQATQLDPFAQQKQRQKQALLAQIMQGFTPTSYGGGQFSGGLRAALPDALKQISSYFGPNAMAGAESAFQQTVQGASPSYVAPGRSTVGYPAGVGPAPVGADYAPKQGPGLMGIVKRLSPETIAKITENNRRRVGGNTSAF